MHDEPALTFALDPQALRPLIAAVVAEALAQLEDVRATLDDRMAFSEPEAAVLLGLESHQLRDARRRGDVAASALAGGRIRYTRQDLLDYLRARRLAGGEPARKRR
jgi:hypothetical protein